ncbi:MAG TPA: beta-propeller fold lactonase family protein, partial [Rubricoccaceae bacterium]
MLRLPAVAFAAFALVTFTACDAADASAPVPFDPSTVNYDALTPTDYETQIRPLLAARNVLSPVATDAPGDPADYALDAVVMAGPSGFVVPFDAPGSLMVRFTADLPDTAAIPFPNLRRLEADERAFVARWIESGARATEGGAVPFSDATDLLFACLQGANHVDILDAETMRIIRRVHFDALGLPSAPYGPHHVAFEPGGSAWYVSLISTGAVAKLSTDLSMDPDTPAYLLATARMTTPGMLAIDPSSNRLYVGRSTLSAATTTGFAIIDRTTMAVDEVATPFNVPHAMAVTPDGRFVLTASLTGGQVAVYNTATEDLAIQSVPGGPHELIHFAVLGAHHGGRAAAPASGHAGMDHSTMDHSAHGATPDASAMHAYEATLTSRTTDTVLFFSMSPTGELTMTGTAPGGDGPWHAHVAHDGRTMLIPDRNGNTVTILDAVTKQTLRTVAASAPAGPISQPHSPAPDHMGERFFVTSSNLNGAWTPPYLFLGPAGSDDARAPLAPAQFSNVTA